MLCTFKSLATMNFAVNWPKIDPDSIINKANKYVVTSNPIPVDTDIWKNSLRIDGDLAEKIKCLRVKKGLICRFTVVVNSFRPYWKMI